MSHDPSEGDGEWNRLPGERWQGDEAFTVPWSLGLRGLGFGSGVSRLGFRSSCLSLKVLNAGFAWLSLSKFQCYSVGPSPAAHENPSNTFQALAKAYDPRQRRTFDYFFLAASAKHSNSRRQKRRYHTQWSLYQKGSLARSLSLSLSLCVCVMVYICVSIERVPLGRHAYHLVKPVL